MDCVYNSISRFINELDVGIGIDRNKKRQLNNYVNLIDTINNPELINNLKDVLINNENGIGDTLFMSAIRKSYSSDIALSLLRNNLVNAEHINERGDTPLLLAIKYRLPEVAIELIKTGNSLPDTIDNEDSTALIYACQYGMENVAVELIKTGQSLPDYIHPRTQKSAIDCLKEKNMTSALNEIQAQKGINVASVSQLRTTKTDIAKPIEERKGYRSIEGSLNRSLPPEIEGKIKEYLGGKIKRKSRKKNKKNIKSKKLRRH
jgi:ankyrin repeat protein